MDESNVKGPF